MFIIQMYLSHHLIINSSKMNKNQELFLFNFCILTKYAKTMRQVATKTIKVNKPIPNDLKIAIEAKQEWKNDVTSGKVKTSKDKSKRFL